MLAGDATVGIRLEARYDLYKRQKDSCLKRSFVAGLTKSLAQSGGSPSNGNYL